MESCAFLVSFIEVVNALYKKERRAVVMAENSDKAIEYIEKLVNSDVVSSSIVAYTGFVATAMKNQEILLDNGTFATKNIIFYENDIINRNEMEN